MRKRVVRSIGIFLKNTFRSTRPSLSQCIAYTKSKKVTNTSMIKLCSLRTMVNFSADFAVSTIFQKIKESKTERKSQKSSHKQGKT